MLYFTGASRFYRTLPPSMLTCAIGSFAPQALCLFLCDFELYN
ncbi:MAG: hypothetical protein ACBR14_07850 [Microcoleus sp.]